jgi:spermidine synthase
MADLLAATVATRTVAVSAEVSARRYPCLARHAMVGLIFCVSGIPALIYQMAWQRILALHTGVGVYSVAMIVAAFLGGLGIGNLAGGLLSGRLSPRGALRTYAAVEFGIGVLAALSCPVYYDLLYLGSAWNVEPAWWAGVIQFAVLLPPTCLMGMTLPLLVHAMVHDANTAGRMIDYLYGVNVLGAAIGAAIAPWWLIPSWGIRGAVLAGVACNGLAAVGAWLVGSGESTLRWTAAEAHGRDGRSSREVAADSHRGRPIARHAFALWVALYGWCGFQGLALEILWFRLCDVAAKSTAFTFGTVLAVYLAGLAAGSLVGATVQARWTRPLRLFLIWQCLILVAATAMVLVIAFAPTDLPVLRELLAYWRGYDGVVPGRSPARIVLVLYLLVPLALFGLPTVLMGLSFAALQRAVQDGCRTSGRKVGILQAVNIAGCVAGSLLAGTVMLNQLGTTGTLRVLCGGGMTFVGVGLWYCGWRSSFWLLGGLLAVLAWLLPSQDALWRRLHGQLAGTRWVLVDEDATGVVAITPEPQGNLRVSVDGKGHSWLPFGSVHSRLGIVPAVVHPAPRRLAIIGLGSGDTAWAASCRSETEHVAVFELCAPEQRLLERVARTGAMPELHRFLRDPRLSIEVADGRNALARSTTPYDLIEADASRPETAYAGNLYSVEFFELCRRRLNRGGIFCTWSPTPRVTATFAAVFPHVLEFSQGELLIGSQQSLPAEPAMWTERLRSVAVQAYLGPGLVEEVSRYVTTVRHLPPAGRSKALNRDLFPRDEFSSSK